MRRGLYRSTACSSPAHTVSSRMRSVAVARRACPAGRACAAQGSSVAARNGARPGRGRSLFGWQRRGGLLRRWLRAQAAAVHEPYDGVAGELQELECRERECRAPTRARPPTPREQEGSTGHALIVV